MSDFTREIQDFEIKLGFNGSGDPVYFIDWKATATTRFEIEGLDFPFKSESEALANALCQTRCGKRVY